MITNELPFYIFIILLLISLGFYLHNKKIIVLFSSAADVIFSVFSPLIGIVLTLLICIILLFISIIFRQKAIDPVISFIPTASFIYGILLLFIFGLTLQKNNFIASILILPIKVALFLINCVLSIFFIALAVVTQPVRKNYGSDLTHLIATTAHGVATVGAANYSSNFLVNFYLQYADLTPASIRKESQHKSTFKGNKYVAVFFIFLAILVLGIHFYQNQFNVDDDVAGQANTYSNVAVEPAKKIIYESPLETASMQQLESEKDSTVKTSAPTTAINSNYQILDDSVLGKGSLVRTSANLVWQRCSVGQSWNGYTCSGEAQRFTFDAAQQLALNGWRMPSIRELSNLIYFYCQNAHLKNRDDPKDGGGLIANDCSGHVTPLIEVLPVIGLDQYENFYWSSSPFTGSDGYAAWGLVIHSGSISNLVRAKTYYVRLVRDDKSNQ